MRASGSKTAASDCDTRLLRAAINSMPCGFSVWNEQFALELFNQRFLDLFGLPSGEVAPGSTLRQICEYAVAAGQGSGLSVEALFTGLKSCLERQTQSQEPGRLEQFVGDLVIRTSIARHPGIGWMVTHEDISEEVRQRKAEQENKQRLLTRNMWFERAINSMSQGLCAFDGDKNLIICNRAYVEIYNIPEELTRPGTRFQDILRYRVDHGLFPAGETAESHMANRIELVESKSSERKFVEYENDRFIFVLKNPMPGGGWTGVIQDVTEEQLRKDLIKQRSRELKLQNLRFEAAVENMAQGLVMFDDRRRLVICNEQYIELYQLPDELSRPGTKLEDIVAHRARVGMISHADEGAFMEYLDDLIISRRSSTDICEMASGKFISTKHQPVGDGGWVVTHEDVTKRQLNEARIQYLARHDALTDLPNRTYFNEEMMRVESRIYRGEKLALLCLDLDNFKNINDTYGHGIGDEVLRQVAIRLKSGKRDHEIVARMGGDEFMLLAGPVNGPEDVARIAQRILNSLGKPLLIEGREFSVGTSIGIAMTPQDGKDAATLMKHADMALYRTKHEGRRGYRLFQKGMDDAVKQRHKLEIDLKEALDKGQFTLAYQPVLELGSNRVSCCEALLRWEHPSQGTLSAEEFIPVAEETGLIAQLGLWALKSACEAACGWPKSVRVAVNLSAGQITGRRAVEGIKGILKATGLEPDRLELEVSEGALATSTKIKLDMLKELRAVGVRISMDRFGTGFSSIGNLGAFSFDKVKIDRAFMANIEASRENREVVKAIISLGQSLGIVTTATGVETEAQLDIVSKYGCTEVQGHLFSPPMLAGSIVELLQTIETQAARDAGLAPLKLLNG